MKTKRYSVLEVAEILRKYDKHRLNRKIYRNFDSKDFEAVQYIVDHGEPNPSDLLMKSLDKLYVLQDDKGNRLEFDSLNDMAEHFDFKAKSYWKLYTKRAGYTIVENLENHE
jgi:hypothetical protein